MKEIKAFIKPKRAQVVIEALSEAGFQSMTISQAEGTGAHKAKGASPSLDFHVTDSPVVKLELVCQNEEMDKAILRCGSRIRRRPEPIQPKRRQSAKEMKRWI